MNSPMYSLQEFQVVTAAKEIKDGDIVLAGVGFPLLGTLLALMTHAPNSVVAMEGGGIGCRPRRIVLGVGCNAINENAIYSTSLGQLFSDMQRGYFDVGMVGGAQVDKFGNLNSTAIFGDGDYYHPKNRLPGSGGANDIATSCGRTLITMKLQKRAFVNKIDYITSPGHLTGGDARKQLGLPGGGPSAIITDKCVFRFDPDTKEAYLDSLFPGVTVEDVESQVSWPLKISSGLFTTPEPTEEELRIVRTLDPEKVYLGRGLNALNFDEYIQMLDKSKEVLDQLYLERVLNR